MNNKKRIIPLQGVLNARDLGGLPLKNNKKVKKNTIIRSGRISNPTESDKITLVNLWNVTRIIDIRNNQEIKEYPDVKLEGTVYQQVSILPGEKEGISREDYGMDKVEIAIVRAKKFLKGNGAKDLLESMYSQMATDEYCIKKMKEFFNIILNHEEGAFLWHCTSGKDRTGITAALLLHVLGADMETIKSDYLYTNIQNKNYRENLLEMMREKGASEEEVNEICILESVDWGYVNSFIKTIEKNMEVLMIF